MWLRVALKFPIGFLDKPLVYYGRSTGSNITADSAYMDAGVEYIFNKYAHYKGINKAKKKYWLFRVYETASLKPSWGNFKFILKHIQFNFIYGKQVLKFFVKLFFYKNR
jgi:hypothetical protein